MTRTYVTLVSPIIKQRDPNWESDKRPYPDGLFKGIPKLPRSLDVEDLVNEKELDLIMGITFEQN